MSITEILNKLLDEVQQVDDKQFPYNIKFVHLPRKVWESEKRNILREILKRPNISIEINGWMGGGYSNKEHIIQLSKKTGLPAISDNEMEKNIDDFIAMEVKGRF